MSATPAGALSLPDIVASAFTLFVRYPGQFLLISLFSTPLALLNNLFVALIVDSSIFKTSGGKDNGATESIAVPFLLCGVWLVGMLLAFVSDALLVPAALDAMRGYRPRVRVSLTTFLAAIAPLLIAWLLIGTATALLLLSAIGVPVALFLLVRWGFAVQVVERERLPALQALRRSSQIVQGRWWRTALVHAAILVLGSLPSIVLARAVSDVNELVVDVAVGVIIWWLTAPFGAIGRTLLYTDTLLRKGERLQPPQALAG